MISTEEVRKRPIVHRNKIKRNKNKQNQWIFTVIFRTNGFRTNWLRMYNSPAKNDWTCIVYQFYFDLLYKIGTRLYHIYWTVSTYNILYLNKAIRSMYTCSGIVMMVMAVGVLSTDTICSATKISLKLRICLKLVYIYWRAILYVFHKVC